MSDTSGENDTSLEAVTLIDFGKAIDECTEDLTYLEFLEDLTETDLYKLTILKHLLDKTLNSYNSRNGKNKKYTVPLTEDYWCPLCMRREVSAMALKDHLRLCLWDDCTRILPKTDLHILLDGLECKTCEKLFSKYEEFEEHAKEDHPYFRYTSCLPCSMPIIQSYVHYEHHIASGLHKHMARKSVQEVKNSFEMVVCLNYAKCNVCAQIMTVGMVTTHAYVSHRDDYCIWCQMCDDTIKGKNWFHHVRTPKHSSRPRYPVICPFCGLSIVGEGNFKKHLETVENIIDYPTKNLFDLCW